MILARKHDISYLMFIIHSKRLLNYILCIRFFIEVHSIVSASRFFHIYNTYKDGNNSKRLLNQIGFEL